MNNLIYIWIPKTAGTSFWRSITKKHPNFRRDLNGKSKFFFGTYGHVYIKHIFSKEELNSVKKICVCRNPYDRFVSLYFYSKKSKFIDQSLSLRDFAKKVCVEKIDPIGKYNVSKLSYCNPQNHWIKDIDDVKVYRFENIDKLFSDYKIKNIKLNTSNHKHYLEYFKDEDILKMVNDFYKEDFEIFNYDVIESFKKNDS